MRYKFQVTKYNPKNRNALGHYQLDEWTSISDIGKPFSGQLLTKQEYCRVESAYLFAIESFMVEAGVSSLLISGLEQYFKQHKFQIGDELGLKDILRISQLSLREELWCQLSAPGRAYVHFGYDYYMHVGVPRQCLDPIDAVQKRGLFVESCRSPHLRPWSPQA